MLTRQLLAIMDCQATVVLLLRVQKIDVRKLLSVSLNF